MTVVADWPDRAERLVRSLAEKGKVSSPVWQAAVRAVPRHEFVPVFYEQRGGAWEAVDETQEHWLDLVYSNTALVTLLDEVPTSSSSEPGLMTRMLEALDVRDGDRVLEIGTGTGSNAALLAHRLGDANVFSVDVEPGLVTTAPAAGGTGLPPGAGRARRCRRIARTRAVRPDHRHVRGVGDPVGVGRTGPRRWSDPRRRRTRPLRGESGDVAPHGRRGWGRFLPGRVDFMDLRQPGSAEPARHPDRDHARARVRATELLTERPWEQPTLWFLAHTRFQPGLRFGYAVDAETGEPGAVFLSTVGGSWCEVSTRVGNGVREVREAGPVALWRIVEEATDLWLDKGKPEWERFGLTITEGSQRAWLDKPPAGSR